jgi:hypothetical protein
MAQIFGNFALTVGPRDTALKGALHTHSRFSSPETMASISPKKRLGLNLVDLGSVMVQSVKEGALTKDSESMLASNLWCKEKVPVIIYAVRRPG